MVDVKHHLSSTIVDIIDNELPYRIVRRPYDAAFAEAHNLLLKDIAETQFVPCITCGEDISARILLHTGNGPKPVFCSTKCRSNHGILRMRRISDATDVNALVETLVKSCLTVEHREQSESRISSNNASIKTSIMRTNALLEQILEVLTNGARKT